LDGDFNRIVKVVKSGSKKPMAKDKYYPLYVMNKATLAHEEIPERFNKYFPVPANIVSDEPLVTQSTIDPADFGEYLSLISKYDLNTEIVPKVKLESYIKAKKKKFQKENDKALSEFDDDDKPKEQIPEE
jgi:hypothetical protein